MIKFLMSLIILLMLGVTILAQEVDSVWVNTLEGPGGAAAGKSVTVGPFGNVYVAGYTSGTTLDCITLKYRPSGDSVWAATYNGPGNSYDRLNDIKTDTLGNIYVTGASVGSGGNSDIITIKYDSSGIQQWASRFQGAHPGDDEGYALAVDNNGYVYVTGRCWDGSGNDYDVVAIKYQPNGDTSWVRKYLGMADTADAGYAIDVDDYGIVYVAGAATETFPTTDIFVRKYMANGSIGWTDFYEGTGNGSDTAFGLVVKDDGTVFFVTGKCQNSGTGYDYVTMKYSHVVTTPIWVETYDGGNAQLDEAVDIALDSENNIIVTGTSTGVGTATDITTIKYDEYFGLEWVKRFDWGYSSADFASALAIDQEDNIYVTGYSFLGPSLTDYTTIKYDSNGDTAWARTYNGPDNYIDRAYDIAVDDNGGAYVTGDCMDSYYNNDMVTIKYDILGPLEVKGYSPINLWITDPAGLIIGRNAEGDLFQTLFPADYYEVDPGPTDVVDIYFPIEGEYSIRVIATTSIPGETYSLGVRLDGLPEIMLAVNVDVPIGKGSHLYNYIVEDNWHYKNGDANRDEILNIFDVTFLISYLYLDGEQPYPEGAGDANCDLVINIFDITHLISFLYMDGPAPCEMSEQ